MGQDTDIVELRKEIQSLKQQIELLKTQVQSIQQSSTISPDSLLDHSSKHPLNHPQHHPSGVLSGKAEKKSPSQERTKATKRDSQGVDLEVKIGKVWLPRVAIIVILLGLISGFAAAVKAGYLTEPVRLAIGIVFAALLLVYGEWQMRRSRAAFGQALLGGGISVLVLTSFAGNMLYHLIGNSVAFGFDVIFLAAGVYLSIRHQSQALAILSAVGAYLVPFLIAGGKPNTPFFVTYEWLVSMVFYFYAARKKYAVLYYSALAAFQLVLLIYALVDRSWTHFDLAVVTAGALASHGVLLGTFIRRKQTDKVQDYLTLFSSLLFTLGWSAGYFNWFIRLFSANGFPFQSPHFVTLLAEKWLLFAIFLVYAGLTLYFRSEQKRFAFFLASALTALLMYFFAVLHGPIETTAMLAEGLFALYVSLHYRNKLTLVIGLIVLGLGTIVTLVHPLETFVSGYTLVWFILVSGLGLVVWKMFIPRLKQVLFWVESGLVLIFLSELSHVLTGGLQNEFRHLVMSFVWALYALSLVFAGMNWSKREARWAGIGLLFITLGKIVLTDLPSVSLFIRAVLFIGLGIVGIFASRLFYRQK